MTSEEECKELKIKSKYQIIKRLAKINKRYFETEPNDAYNAEQQEQDAGQIIALSWILGIKLKGVST
jgi:hypothetical protein